MTSRIVLETKYGKIIRATPQTSGTTILCRLPYTKKPSPIEPNSNPQRRDDVSNAFVKRLTVKLRGRPEAPNWSRGCILSSRTRGDTTDSHGPLQRLLERMATNAVMPASAPRTPSAPQNKMKRMSSLWLSVGPIYRVSQE